MDAPDLFCPGKISHGSRDAQHPGVAAGRQAHCLYRLHQQLAARFVRGGVAFKQFAVELGIGVEAGAFQPVRLDRAGGSNPRGDLCGAFGWGRQGKIDRPYRINLYMKVDAVRYRIPFKLYSEPRASIAIRPGFYRSSAVAAHPKPELDCGP